MHAGGGRDIGTTSCTPEVEIGTPNRQTFATLPSSSNGKILRSAGSSAAACHVEGPSFGPSFWCLSPFPCVCVFRFVCFVNNVSKQFFGHCLRIMGPANENTRRWQSPVRVPSPSCAMSQRDHRSVRSHEQLRARLEGKHPDDTTNGALDESLQCCH